MSEMNDKGRVWWIDNAALVSAPNFVATFVYTQPEKDTFKVIEYSTYQALKDERDELGALFDRQVITFQEVNRRNIALTAKLRVAELALEYYTNDFLFNPEVSRTDGKKMSAIARAALDELRGVE